MEPVIAYLAQGKLLVKTGADEPRVFESKFGETVRERAHSIQRRHGWKTEGRGAKFMGGLMWGMPERDPSTMRIAITSITRGAAEGELLFSLDTEGLGGVFSFRVADALEKRLLHGSDRRLTYLAARPGLSRVACSVFHPDGSASVAVMNPDATDLTEVTEGDSLDLAPSWVPGSESRLVFQSAGIGRDGNGIPSGLAPFEVHELDLAKGELTTVAEAKGADLLGPRRTGDGTLYYIRRPHKDAGGRPVLRTILDFLLIPPRLLFAVFQYFNFFSSKYTGKPLMTAGGPKREGADMKQMMIWGNLIDAANAAKQNGPDGDGPPALVPRSWKLVRQLPSGSIDTLADGVLSYDLAPDGAVVYTTGSAIYRLPAGQPRERVLTGQAIEQVIAL